MPQPRSYDDFDRRMGPGIICYGLGPGRDHCPCKDDPKKGETCCHCEKGRERCGNYLTES
jgi:hypothetical protein